MLINVCALDGGASLKRKPKVRLRVILNLLKSHANPPRPSEGISYPHISNTPIACQQKLI